MKRRLSPVYTLKLHLIKLASPTKGASQSDLEDLPMGRIILNKLRSSKGASLTFALLAFLVCAVVSAVLLASASASAGRVSGLAESDQRYYAVTSAAQLFCDTMKEQEYVIERRWEHRETKRTDYTAQTVGSDFDVSLPYDYNPEGSGEAYFYNKYSLWMKTPYAAEDAQVSKVSSLQGERNLAMDLALYYVFGDLSPLTVSEGKTALGKVTDLVTSKFNSAVGNEGVFKMTMEVTDTTMGFLTVNVELTIRNDGTLIADFTNNKGSNNEKFTVQVVMTPKIEDNSGHPNVTETTRVTSHPDGENSYYTLTVATKETAKTTTISWVVSEIKKKVS